MENSIPSPGDVLREYFLKPRGITQNKLALDIRVPANRINEIINGKRDISVDTAIRLGKYFQTDPFFWLTMQSKHDIANAKVLLQEELAYIPICEKTEAVDAALESIIKDSQK